MTGDKLVVTGVERIDLPTEYNLVRDDERYGRMT